MGSIISKIHDDYNDYLDLCKWLSIEPIPVESTDPFTFYGHTKKIISEIVNEETLERLKQIGYID